jgi:hypothetical protein
MAFVKVRVPRTSQPQELVTVAGLPAGSIVVIPSNSAYPAIGGITRTPTQSGVSLTSSGTGDYINLGIVKQAVVGATTWVFQVQATSAASVAAGTINTGTSYIEQFMLNYDTEAAASAGSKNFALSMRNNSGALRYSTLVGVLDYAKPVTIVMELTNSTTVNAWVNGVSVSVAYASFSGSMTTTAQDTGFTYDLLNANARGSHTSSAAGLSVGLFARVPGLFNNPQSVSANPWQIFEPEERLIWIPDAVSAGGSATVIPIGQQATGSVGSPSAIGAATTAAAGVSAVSAVGTPTAVGDASIPAAVSPAGVISASSVGTPTATGASITIAGGVQAISSVGTPTAIAGTSIPATALPAGVSALASVGTPSANGASIAYAGGISAFSAVGAPTAIGGISGQATALPAGVQAISYVGVPTATAAAVVYAYGVQAIGYVGIPVALGDPVAFTPSVYQAISPAQSYTTISPAQSYTAISPAQSYTVTVQPQIYIA